MLKDHIAVASVLDGKERAGCFTWFVFLVSRDCCVALPCCVIGLSAVCDCGISYHSHLLFLSRQTAK